MGAPVGKEQLVGEGLTRAGLWKEMRGQLGGARSGGQQQRLCIARSLAVRPQVLLMDEPCSALDPTSTRAIEETISELSAQVTIVIVTHNMQQAARVSDQCAFLPRRTPRASSSSTGLPSSSPQDQRTADGRFG